MAVAAGADQLRRLVTELWRPEDLSRGASDPTFAPHALIGGSSGEALTVVPLSSRTVAAASMIRWTDATTPREGLVRGAAWAGLRTGLAQPLLRSRIDVRMTGGEGPTLHEYLAKVVAVDQVAIACAFGSERPNQKPVLRILDSEGETLGFAKVGWNELTHRLVETEMQFLDALAGQPLRTMVAPKPIQNGSWNGRTIAVSSAELGTPNWRRPAPPGLDVLQELAGLTERFRVSIGASKYRQSLNDRAGDLANTPPIGAALALIGERWADQELEFGHWHGDWAPWNMRRRGDRIVVWDWERTGSGIPVGFDALHFVFQPRFTGSSDPLAALLDATEQIGPLLGGLGVTEAARPALVLLYLTELLVRFSNGGQEQPAAAAPHMNAVTELLIDAVGHFGV